MNVMQSRKANGEKPFPGCLGRMVNLFDLSTGIASNRMLTDRPHYDGSSLGRSQSDVARMSSPFGDKIEDKLIVSELRRTSSNKKANGTPMKMLIDQEMSKEIESKNDPPNVVAKLMGLDALPRQQPHSSLQRSHTNGYSKSNLSHSGMPLGSWRQEDGFSESRLQFDIHQCPKRNEYKDVYEVWQQPQNKHCVKDKSPQNDRHNANPIDGNMALVRQKFMEAKRLATDEKLRESKEFQNALDVLSSNRDLFVKFLQEPTSMYSQHLYELHSMPPPPETKRITVLRPSKIVDNEKFSGSRQKSDKPTNKIAQMGQEAVWDKSNPGHSPKFSNQKIDEYPIQPTRIVVLKPSPGKTHDIRAVIPSPISSPRMFHGENIYEDPDDDEARESREVAKEITRQMRDNLMGHRRDETLLSSVFSNGYTGDESSFNKSENEYVAENLCDSEVMSPSSRHSWDYINRSGSPLSSSFSRASCSPESSVCREAKKRLSERWAMMASNGNSQELRHVRRSSSTLGEMLALSDMKKSVRPEDEINKEQEPRELVSCLTSDLNKEGVCNSPRSLLRSKSLPVSSTVFGARLNMEVSDAVSDRTDVPKQLTKAKSTKSSLKGKVSSLFFSRSKKSSKEKSGLSGSNESQSASAETPRVVVPPGMVDAVSQSGDESGREECFPPAPCGSSGKVSLDATTMDLKQGIVSREAGLSLTKPTVPRNVSENQDQPSPISVLEPPFEEDDNITRESSGYVKPDLQGQLLRSNLIDKSPPIESIARTLSWDDSCIETATPYPLKPPSVTTVAEEDEQDWLAFVQTLLSAAGIDREMRCESRDSDFLRWQSPEAPIDPSLRDKYANVDDKEPLHETKRRKLRSTRKLVFDSVNAALADISGYGSDRSISITCGRAHGRLLEGDSPLLVDLVWGRMKDWFLGEVRCVWEDSGDANSLVVDGVVRKEVVGKGWTELMRLEMDNIGKEIEGNLLEELVEEAVVDLTGRI